MAVVEDTLKVRFLDRFKYLPIYEKVMVVAENKLGRKNGITYTCQNSLIFIILIDVHKVSYSLLTHKTAKKME